MNDEIGKQILAQMSEMRSDMANMHKELNAVEKRLDAKFDKLDVKIDQVEERLDAKIDQVEERLDARIDALTDETRKGFNRLEEMLNANMEEQAKINHLLMESFIVKPKTAAELDNLISEMKQLRNVAAS